MTASSTAGGRRTADKHLNPCVVRVFGDMRFRVDSDLSALAFAADGGAWSVEESGVLRQWDGESGKLLARQESSDVEVIWAFSPDARQLASGSDSVSLWNVVDGGLLLTMAQPSWVTALCFRGDGKMLATGHDDGLVRLWDLRTGALLADGAGHDDTISALAFTRDGQRLASASEDRTICLWEVGREEPLGRLEGHTDRIQALAWHPSGNRLVSAGWDTTARVWDPAAMEPVILLNGHADVVSAIAFSPDGKILASADSDHLVWLWDFAANKPLHKLKGHMSEITCLAFRNDGKRLLSGGQDRRLLLWDVLSGRNLLGVSQQTCETARISLSPDGRRLAYANGDMPVQIWDAAAGEVVHQLPDSDHTLAVSYSPDGKWLATGDADNHVHVWQTGSHKLHKTLDGHHAAITSLSFSADSQMLASAGGTDGYVYVWSMASFEPLLLIPHATDNSTAETIGFCPGTNLVAAGGIDWLSTGGSDGAICLWDVANRCEVATFSGGTARLALRPDGLQLAAATLNDSFCLWDIPSQSLAKEIQEHDGKVACLAYDRQGKLLASGGDDQRVCLWRADTGELAAVVDLDTQIKDLVFTPDGKGLYTANANTTCYLIDLGKVLPR